MFITHLSFFTGLLSHILIFKTISCICHIVIANHKFAINFVSISPLSEFLNQSPASLPAKNLHNNLL
jgi:hypothetical protein